MRSAVLFLTLLLVAVLPRPAHALVVLGWHDIKDRIADGEPDVQATSTRNLAMQLDWLRAHGYVPVTAQAVRDAHAGRSTLPPKSVLLTFDGGWRSAYTHALPLLRAFNWPALVAVPTARVDRTAGGTVRVGLRDVPRDAFLTWNDVKALQASGLVEVASEGNDLVTPVIADPQGDLLPGASTRRWSAGAYETDAAYRDRVQRDLSTSADLIARATGRRPQALLWPDRRGGDAARGIAASLGMPLVLDSEARSGTADLHLGGHARFDGDGMHPVRLVMTENPGAGDLAYELRRDPALDGMRAVRVRLDDIVGPDDATTSRNIDALAERIRSIKPTHVLLSALSDDNGNGPATAAWFPARGLPMRADVFTHAAARLMARAGVDVFAWVPAGSASATLYDDLATLPVSGIVVDGDTATPPARSQWRDLVTVRALALPSATATLAPQWPSLNGYDFVAVMLPPGLRASTGAVDRIVANAAAQPQGLERTIFVLDTGDAAHPVAAAELEAEARRVIASGGRHVAYSRDDALKDQPPLEPARAAISARAFPYLER